MQPSDFDYDFPPELIAQTPLAQRSASRLLVLEGRTGRCEDLMIRDLPQLLQAGDLLVLNDTQVVAARLIGSKSSGGRVEILLERPLEGHQALVQLRGSKALRVGMELTSPGGPVQLLERCEDLWRVELTAAALELFEKWGDVPLPPYIRRPATGGDRDRYQSIFAREAGAVAAPTASLHFDEALVAAVDARGVRRACVTLHVGAGTFQPVRAGSLEGYSLHPERVAVSAATCEAIRATRSAGGRVIAVGTTVVRALESAAAQAQGGALITPFVGETRLFIRPGFRFQVIDALLTNFHVPQSTLLMLVCAFAGRDQTLAAYAHALERRYRLFSYGDAMFVTPGVEAAP